MSRGRDVRVCVDLSPAQIDSLETYAVGRALAAEDRTDARLWSKIVDAIREAKPLTKVERVPCGYCGRAIGRAGRYHIREHKCPHGEACRGRFSNRGEPACVSCRAKKNALVGDGA